jgi:4-hydroxybenzoate polyprenyltransferase
VEAAGNEKISFGRKVGALLEMIKFQHTIFALPFALMAALVASNGRLPWDILLWILVAMVGARSSAMTFNRIVDRHIDARNPRTANRELPRGVISVAEAWIFFAITTGLFIFAAANLNRLALLLTPVALLIIWGYSLTKRFTKYAHVFLGLALAIAPVGAWVAVTGAIHPAVLWLAGAVLCWVAGFDIIYALHDIEFDKKEHLHSIPSKWGPARALVFSSFLHIFSVLCLVIFGFLMNLGLIYFIGCIVALMLLEYEHSLVNPEDFSKVDAAFFTMNGFVSVGLLIFTALSIYFPIRFPL